MLSNLRQSSVFIFILIIILTISCGKEEIAEKPESNLLRVDSSKIGIQIVNNNFGISYSPPLGWELMPSELSERYVARLNKEKFSKDHFVYKPLNIYFNKINSGLLSVGIVELSSDKWQDSVDVNYYSAQLEKNYPNNMIEKMILNTDQLKIIQLKLEKANLITLKNLFQNESGQIFQFDYSIQKKLLEKENGAIQSSIASIKLLP
ncbi:MAG: hypothetical protein KAQ90_10065 [Melioribacteraceae bacterium]|nr:hypothetical protein [Melioribacteraceae bacterium]